MTNEISANKPKSGIAPIAGAATALVLLTALNFVNYIDRYILPGVQELVKKEFHVTDSEIGSITFWFFLTYMLAAPLTGWLGDHLPRKPLIVGCALLISGVNILTGTVHAFDSLLIRHAILGIGEASLGIYAPALLADFYPEDQRNRILTIFYTAIPVGAALGYLIGEIVGAKFGWRMPFYVSAVPGFLIAMLILFMMKEPARGGSDVKASAAEKDAPKKSAKQNIFDLAKNAPYITATLGMAMVTFSLGGISAWMPSFLERSGFSANSVGITLGAITAGGGLGGTAAGGWIAQRWLRTNHRALYLVSAWSAALAVPPALLCFFGPRVTMLPALAVAMFLIFLGTGPLNAAIINAVPSAVRSTAIAFELLLIHLLGDTPSPKIIGMVSDHSNLATGLGVTLITMLIAAVLLFIGARTAPEVSEHATASAH
ncbi:Sugar phosphate permease [Granulicella rosea]|uniref:Sugar phosphate permease n=1 Tax=Granulicella rosea TaxID=474952 RepID=A0A239HXU6_9BACT|nr:MFS transporter [Granulicella rosea]SNS85908.1 Sugar phosphate permease [Granulicella rosea]